MDQGEGAGDEPVRREIRKELPPLATALDQAQDTGDGGLMSLWRASQLSCSAVA